MADPIPSPRMGLGELATSFAAESRKRMEAMQKSQVDSWSGGPPVLGNAQPKEPKEKAHSRMPSTSPARRCALEMWVKVEVSPEVYAPPEDDSYSIDFAVNTLNQVYPGCIGGQGEVQVQVKVGQLAYKALTHLIQ